MRAITAGFALFIAIMAAAPAMARQLWDWQIWHQPPASQMSRVPCTASTWSRIHSASTSSRWMPA